MKSLLSKLLVFVLLIALIGPLENLNKPRFEFASNGIRANTISVGRDFQLKPLPMAGLKGVASAYEHETAFLSNVLEADFPFDAVGVEWSETRPQSTNINI